MKPGALVVRTAGTNCDLETVEACERAGFAVERVHVGRLVENPLALHEAGLFVIPGGFTYGDDLGAGRILANELRLRLGDALREFIDRGNLALGICNGFQVLVKAWLLPDPARPGPPPVTLTFNDSGRFEARWIRLRATAAACPFLEAGEELEMPVAHGEGKFVAESPAVLDALETGGQVALRYVAPAGAASGYPWNPNGSERDVAGICDPSGRVLGLMPHPERHQHPEQHPQWTRRESTGEADGLRLFQRAFRYLA